MTRHTITICLFIALVATACADPATPLPLTPAPAGTAAPLPATPAPPSATPGATATPTPAVTFALTGQIGGTARAVARRRARPWWCGVRRRRHARARPCAGIASDQRRASPTGR